MQETLGQLIQRRINDLGMSKSELARAIGKSAAYIGDLANDTGKTSKKGRYTPSQEIVSKLARALQVKPEEILATIDYIKQPTKAADESPVQFSVMFSGWEDASEEDRATATAAIEMIAESFQRRRRTRQRKN